MKLTTYFVSLLILFIAIPACAQPNLTGIWCVSMSSAYSQGTTGTPGFSEEEYEIEFLAQKDNASYGIIFYGQVDVGSEYTYFSGVLDGHKISMTHWDSVTRGTLKKKKKTLEISFINNAFEAKDRRAKTSIGVALKGNCPSS